MAIRGLCHDGIFFYVVSDEQDFEQRERRAKAVGADGGVRYRRGYWWHEMKEPEFFSISYAAIPDFDEIISRCEHILSLLKQIKP
ncbi:MAG: hypothetical protein NC453_15130 [Muribaculum sp.]|nr:hypothetical protein [Muribaculum sp.]